MWFLNPMERYNHQKKQNFFRDGSYIYLLFTEQIFVTSVYSLKVSLVGKFLPPMGLHDMTRTQPKLFCYLFLFLSLILLKVQAASSGPESHPHIEVELVSEQASWQVGQTHWVGLALRPEHHWHTYWKNPGDSGLAPSLEWQGPPDIEFGEIAWGFPHRIDVSGIVNFGYEGESLLMVPVTLETDFTATSAQITLNADWLVCKEACIPGSAALSLTLPISQKQPEWTQFAPLFDKARRLLPKLSENFEVSYQLQGERITFQWLDDERFATLALDELDLFVAAEELVAPSEPAQWLRSDGLIQVSFAKSLYFNQLPVATEVVITASGQAWQLTGEQGSLMPLKAPAVSQYSLPVLMLMALVGGVLLNLMPCVFPVLSLKALSLAKMASQTPQAIRRQGWLYFVGIEFSFLALGLVLWLVKASGQAVGWGFQLQEPLFLAALALLLLLMGISLLGAFEIAGGWMSLGQSRISKGGKAAPLLSGFLAVVVASPCMTPLMAPAVGAALLLPFIQMLAILMALGLGLALPIVLLSLKPGWGRLLPKPGPWLETFKQAMAFPLMATAVWLLYLLQQHSGILVIATLALMLSLGFLIWLVQRGYKRFALALALICSVIVVVNWSRPESDSFDELSVSYQPSRLEEFIASRQPVLVNMTADWCLTCKVNEKMTLSNEAVVRAFEATGVIYMVGDWTHRDSAITAYLEEFNHAGVPLYVLYNQQGQAEVLPQILTPQGLIDRLHAVQALSSSDSHTMESLTERK